MSQRKAWVLLVEDDERLAATVALAFIEHGCRICGPASTVDEAVRMLEHCDAAAALIDYRLADSTSEPLVPLLEERHVPICVVTGTLRNELPPSLIRHAVLTKPFGAHDLIEQVDRLLAIRQ
ncbi:MAG TPA: hypothetical protein VFA81_07760 [Burkholderiales bacterium]|nr:hypothetical protein [Burkholderiales bacterium]